MARPKHSCGDELHLDPHNAGSDTAMRALVELFENLKRKPPLYRKYLIERIDDELVFRQTEVSAAIEHAIASAKGGLVRRVIKVM